MNNQIKQIPHAPVEPLRIEREFVFGREIVVIEGVRYDAGYFRVFAHPETEYLYAVQRGEDDVVRLTVIHNRIEAAAFFDETFGADPDFAWDEVKQFTPSALSGTSPKLQEQERNLEEEEKEQGDEDGL